MKKTYAAPQAEMIRFATEDILAVSQPVTNYDSKYVVNKAKGDAPEAGSIDL